MAPPPTVNDTKINCLEYQNCLFNKDGFSFKSSASTSLFKMAYHWHFQRSLASAGRGGTKTESSGYTFKIS